MSIAQNQIRAAYLSIIAVSATAPTVFSLGDSYFNTTNNLLYTAILNDNEELVWGDGAAPIPEHLYFNTATNVFYGVNNGTLIAHIGTGSITNPLNVDLDANSHYIKNLANGSLAGDAVNKGQLDLKADTNAVIPLSQKGVANGVAALDSNGLVAINELPTASSSAKGLVRPDGITITADINGTISSVSQQSYHPNLFDFKWSDHLLNDVSWLRADTFSWQDGTVYSAAYNELLSEYNNASSTTEIDGLLFTQPILSANGTLGGSSFAVSASNITNYDAYKPFSANANSTATDTWAANSTSADYIIYNPVAIYFKSIKIWNRNDSVDVHAITSGTVFGSNDNNTWTQITTFTNSVTTIASEWTIDLSSNLTAYKYIKLSCVNNTGTSAIGFGKIQITAYYVNTITYKRTPKNYKIASADEESNILSLYNTTGVAWYYIIDTTNHRFKLPRTKYGFVGYRNTVGDYVAESLPNITGTINLGSWNEIQDSGGSLYVESSNNGKNTGTEYHGGNLKIDASRSSSTYQDGAPVQQRATQMYLYFYVGNYTQPAIEQTAGLNAGLFNAKADINLNNVANNIDFVVESYTNGTDWYRVYKSGWVEQGGRTTLYSGAGFETITLLKPMANTNYTLLNCNNANGPRADQRDAYIISATQIAVGYDYSQSSGAIWEVKGQGA